MNSGLFCFALLLSGAAQLSAQYTVRQYAVRVEPDIYFGTADNFDGCPVDLYLDLYKPVNPDLCRPVLVLLHGGVWVDGDKRDPEAVQIAHDMAARGYVVASVNYRQGWHLSPPPAVACTGCWAASLLPCGRYAADTAEVHRAAYRAMQDTKGAIRFLKNRSPVDSTSRERFFAGGYDAGATTALLVGFLDKATERPLATFEVGPVSYNGLAACPAQYTCAPPALERPDLGGIDGGLHLSKSFDASVAGVLSWSGALWQLEMLGNSTTPPDLYTFHQKCDHLFPCFDGRLFSSLANCLEDCCPQPACLPLTGMPHSFGGGAIIEYIKEYPDLQIVHQDDIVINGFAIDPLYGCSGSNSGIPFCSNPNYQYCHDFLFNILRMDYIAGFLNSRMPVPNCFLDAVAPEWSPAVQVFPNPASGRVTVLLDSHTAHGLRAVRLWGMDGRAAPLMAVAEPQGVAFETAGLTPGVYLLVLETASGPVMRRLVLL
ncbi:MAG: T9SS type A sorting domain-containing protein [Saprospirales bacterium]|nr:T9SS type A sorting domain-containing protein [Saprospirales bacterium]